MPSAGQVTTTATLPVAQPNQTSTYVAPTQAEIDTCKTEKKIQLISARNVLFKEDVLNEGIWTVLFLLLLLAHYPRFMRLNKKAE